MIRMPLRTRPLAAALTALFLAACGGDGVESVNETPPSHSAGYTQIVAFGDSLTDAGTFNPTTADADPSNDSATGLMFTTKPGGTWAGYIAANLGLSLTPNQQVNFGIVGNGGKVIELGGTDYAEGGARLEVDAANGGVTTQTIPGIGTVPVQGATSRSIKTQIDDYLAEHGSAFNDGQLVLIQGGANDFFNFFSTTPPANLQTAAPAFIQATVTSLVTQIGRLKAAGASHIIYANLPELGYTPQFLALGPTVAGQATALSQSYNNAVAQQLGAMGVTVFDTAKLIRDVVAAPANYGFTNVQTPACNSYTTPGNPATLSALICSPSTLVAPKADLTYLFADGIHPTARAHAIWADQVTATLLADQVAAH
ncbi:hypothetical protein GCM10007860_27250 [Chitiniphilus shinanonensis]|uniref:Uncharacterized protein n=2 Tax=Chitiniphilus shinanonensis TaxID=553088 RepID=A0ABQ6BVP7_9NEIS|nr:hypothetical protein GCM10007860_27250 [Chitiniphilus shinanonensis]